jgi:hypothetical protein
MGMAILLALPGHIPPASLPSRDTAKHNNPPNLRIPSTIVTFLYKVHWLEGGLQAGVC